MVPGLSIVEYRPSLIWRENKTTKMVMFKVDLKFHEAFIKPIQGLYDDYQVTVEGFKENNAELMKRCWIDTRHGDDGGKMYELFDENVEGELIKESMQE